MGWLADIQAIARHQARLLASPSPTPAGSRSCAVGISCWFIAAAGWRVGGPETIAWTLIAGISFCADFLCRDTWWAVADRWCALPASAAVVLRAPLGATLCAAAMLIGSRTAKTKNQWIIFHCLWHACAAYAITLTQ